MSFQNPQAYVDAMGNFANMTWSMMEHQMQQPQWQPVQLPQVPIVPSQGWGASPKRRRTDDRQQPPAQDWTLGRINSLFGEYVDGRPVPPGSMAAARRALDTAVEEAIATMSSSASDAAKTTEKPPASFSTDERHPQLPTFLLTPPQCSQFGVFKINSDDDGLSYDAQALIEHQEEAEERARRADILNRASRAVHKARTCAFGQLDPRGPFTDIAAATSENSAVDMTETARPTGSVEEPPALSICEGQSTTRGSPTADQYVSLNDVNEVLNSKVKASIQDQEHARHLLDEAVASAMRHFIHKGAAKQQLDSATAFSYVSATMAQDTPVTMMYPDTTGSAAPDETFLERYSFPNSLIHDLEHKSLGRKPHHLGKVSCGSLPATLRISSSPWHLTVFPNSARPLIMVATTRSKSRREKNPAAEDLAPPQSIPPNNNANTSRKRGRNDEAGDDAPVEQKQPHNRRQSIAQSSHDPEVASAIQIKQEEQDDNGTFADSPNEANDALSVLAKSGVSFDPEMLRTQLSREAFQDMVDMAEMLAGLEDRGGIGTSGSTRPESSTASTRGNSHRTKTTRNTNGGTTQP